MQQMRVLHWEICISSPNSWCPYKRKPLTAQAACAAYKKKLSVEKKPYSQQACSHEFMNSAPAGAAACAPVSC